MMICLPPQGTPPHTHSSRHGPQHTQHTASTEATPRYPQGRKKKTADAPTPPVSVRRYLRMNYYPPCNEAGPPGGPPPLGISPHTDAGFLTVLAQDELCHSLQVKRSTGHTHTPTENTTPDTDTQTHDKNDTLNPQTNTSHNSLQVGYKLRPKQNPQKKAHHYIGLALTKQGPPPLGISPHTDA